MTEIAEARSFALLDGRAWGKWLGCRIGRRSPLPGDRRGTRKLFAEPVLTRRGQLLDAYAASLVEVACRAEQIQGGERRVTLEAVALQRLVGEVTDSLAPLAKTSDLRLFTDATPCEAACFADPALLRLVLEHLVLHCMSRESAPGHLRVMSTLEAGEARVTILSRTPVDCERAAAELAGATRALAAMGALLAQEPRRGGYLPLSVILRAPRSAQATRKAA